MPSIAKLIAESLDTSVASVSRALNDQPGVSEELRKRILEKAREFNWAPNNAARGLATAQSFGIGFFVADKPGLSATTDPFYGEIMHGVEQALARTNYHLTVASLTPDIVNKPANFRFARERRIDAMVLAGPDIPSDFILAMIQTELPVVLVDNQLEHFPTHSIDSDDEGGAYRAARYLLEHGHRHIGILSGPATWASNRLRVEGYQRAFQEAGLETPVAHVERTTIDSGQEAFRQLIAAAPEVTAICAVNDSMALGAIRGARSIGWQVPRDLSVIGFDNIQWAEMSDPPLTTLDVPKRQLGVEAARRILDLLETPDLAPTHLIVSVRLIERGSVGSPRLGNNQ
ncbi:MAG: LacI family DNA-binding transcriptional regulator [Anaerolineae bacterium]|nr:LacI family DNA-binding transcriptional regulator [Anaerolineae bacterium]